MGDTPFHVLERCLPRVALTHGLLPRDPDLVRARRVAEAAGALPAPTQLYGPIWTDGSACFSSDPDLRRSAWAAVWWDAQGRLCYQHA